MLAARVVQIRESMVVDVVIPARNCARDLAYCLRNLPWRDLRSVVVVDNASTDNSSQIARDAGAVVLREPRPGYGACCQRAVQHLESLPVPPAVVVFVDPVGRAEPSRLPELVHSIHSGAELALAVVPGAQSIDAAVAVRMIGVIYRHRFAAIEALRAIRFPALIALGLEDRGDGWNVEMQVKALRLGLHITEVEVLERREISPQKQGVRGTLGKASSALYRVLRHATAR